MIASIVTDLTKLNNLKIKTIIPLFPIVVFGAVLRAQQPAPQGSIKVDIDLSFAKHGIQALGYTDPRFPSAMEQVAGPAIASRTARLHPYVLIISSTGPSEPALAVVRCPRVTGAGATIEGTTTHLFPKRTARLFALMPDSVSSVTVNSSGKLITPDFDSSIYSEFTSKFDPKIFPHGTVSLDLVIFADGGAVGPDRAGMYEVELAKATTEMDILSKLKDNAISDEQLKAWLTAAAGGQAGITGPDHGPNYIGDHRIGVAQHLLRVMDALGGRSQLADWYTKIQADRRPQASSMRKLN